MRIFLKQLVNQILSGLNARQSDILESRYGLLNSEYLTLQAIGDKYGLTREGIRRIEAQALEIIKKNLNKPEFQSFVKLVVSHLRKIGGVRKEADLAGDIKLLVNDQKSEPLLVNYLKFLLEISNAVFYHKEDKNFHNYWYLTENNRQKALKFINSLVKDLKDGVSPTKYFETLGTANYAAVSKKFAVNIYGQFGLAESGEIAPKNARDWAYLILKKEKRPLHFVRLADLVNQFQSRKLHPQTVHNELIKDSNFVLVGKGTYGLREYGYIPGIAREVITRLIRKNGPLTPQEVIKLALQERLFKEQTILVNLQNRNHFKRLTDGRYTTLV